MMEKQAKFNRRKWATETWEEMKKIDPEGCAKVEKVVKRNVACAEAAGAFGKPPTKH